MLRRYSQRPKIVLRQIAVYGLLSVVAFLFLGCTTSEDTTPSNMPAIRAEEENVDKLRLKMRKVVPFFKPMGKPAAYDWLASHNESGQTFDQYLDSDPTKPTKERQKIYVLPLGTFTPQQKKVIDITTGYLGAFYDLPVEQMPARPLAASSPYIRQNKYAKTRQIKTGFILDQVLEPILPSDAAALIAFTIDDLYPDETMNYVFGQASTTNRVGVWSLYRIGDHANFDTFLRRTLKIATHETGHMFSIKHCTKYECVMSGTNHLGETDSRPIDACPECMAKICWLSDIDPAARYDRLAAFCQENGLYREADDFVRKSAAVKKN